MFAFLLVIHALIAAALVAVILMQKSEGGGLGMGGSPSGLMSARGAADFLTRATATLATLFVVMSISLAVYASTRRMESVDTSLARSAPLPSSDAVPNTPADGAALQGAAGVAAATGGNAAAPVDNGAVPLAH
ncbi:preprotein translocase subunit SecG [Sphingomonas gellani]|uniref:Protein-export membrane protein SecG n=1 Tax=Sphingomonas gellani TaxID=1166340 RepID=A0A1H7ZD63_9SPHN|nr:preprotein translocase subunit SecG [Sphingomonas gellani]SEM56256.1 preprotein translocase subunit SecG [Sphingomonas gellani]